MGKLKDEAIETPTEDIQEFKLTDGEAGYLKLLNLTLQYHTYGQKIMSGFLYYVCTQRLGYKEGQSLQFEFDFSEDNKDNKVIIKLVPADPEPTAETITEETQGA